jgi:hypothetical protein
MGCRADHPVVIRVREFHRIPKLKFGALLTEGGAERLELARA